MGLYKPYIPTPEEVGSPRAEEHNIKTYTSFSQIGLKSSDFDSANLSANLMKIRLAMADFSQASLSGNRTHPFVRSLTDPIAEKFGLTFLDNHYFGINILKYGKLSIPIKTEVTIDHSTHPRIWFTISDYVTSDGVAEELVRPFNYLYHPDGYLLTSGGILSGTSLYNYGGYSRYFTNGSLTAIQHFTDGDKTKTRDIQVRDHYTALEQALKMQNTIDGSTNLYNIFGEHNKPSGSYNGTGSSTSRTIKTGGLSDVIEIHGNGYSMIVCPNGAICVNNAGTVTGIPATEIFFANGNLTITSDNAKFNGASQTYTWNVL